LLCVVCCLFYSLRVENGCVSVPLACTCCEHCRSVPILSPMF
jgi:hypothetical protein